MHPLVKDPASIPPDVWDRAFADPVAFGLGIKFAYTATGQEQLDPQAIAADPVASWAPTIANAMANNQLPDNVVNKIKEGIDPRLAVKFAHYVSMNPHHKENLLVPLMAQIPPPRLFNQVGYNFLDKMPRNALDWAMNHWGINDMPAAQLVRNPHLTGKELDHLYDASSWKNDTFIKDLVKAPNLSDNLKAQLFASVRGDYFYLDDLVNRPDFSNTVNRAISEFQKNEDDRDIDVRHLPEALIAVGRKHPHLLDANALDAISRTPELHGFFSQGVSHDLKWTPEQVSRIVNTPSDHIDPVHFYFAHAKATPIEMLDKIADGMLPEASAAASTRVSPEKAREVWQRWQNHFAGSHYDGATQQMTRIPDYTNSASYGFADRTVNTPEDVLMDIAKGRFDTNKSHDSVAKVLNHPNVTPSSVHQLFDHAINRPAPSIEAIHNIFFEKGASKADEKISKQFMDRFGDFLMKSRNIRMLSNVLSHGTQDDFEHFMRGVRASPELDQPTKHRFWQMGQGLGLAALDGNHVEARFGTHRLRKARSIVGKAGGQMHEKDLKALGIDLKKMGHGKLVDGKGMVTEDAITNHIASMPALKYHVSHDFYSGEHQSHVPGKEQHVFQLNASQDQLRELSKAGLLTSYHEYLNHSARYHPHNITNGLGWVRYTKGKDGHIHIDEIQSDFNDVGAHASYVKGRHDEEPGDWKKMYKKLWGGKNPTDVLHEAFHQHLRDQGRIGKEVHIWDIDAKHKNEELMGLDADKPAPHHAVNTYRNFPEKMGYEPAEYGSISTQKNTQYAGQKTHKIKMYKSVDDWLYKQFGAEPLAKSYEEIQEDYNHVINRWELPVKAMLGDTWQYPEFRAAKLLAPGRRFDEDKYREALRLYGDDMVMAAIYAYNLPRDAATVNHVKALMDMQE